ncbi:hypothetical protein D1007_57857 [Hordeum vulgare]|nr:hypothetical protein D1007_57857 [Hordeum vulgare]
MEDVEGLMRGLKLSAAERRGIKVGGAEKNTTGDRIVDDPKAVGKLFSEKPVHAGIIGQTLGRIWCPIKGLECKELETNIFLFTFRQAAGWRRALEEGPWWFDKELLVMEEFDPEKTVEEYDFKLIPMWIHVFGLPLGQMNRHTRERIGDDFHELLEVDVGHDGRAMGKYLRVKVKLDITVPLMRGFVLDRDKKEGKGSGVVGVEEEVSGHKRTKGLLCCRFEYEHMLDFCYTCGVVGHGEKECSTRPTRGEVPQFGPWLRAEVHHRRNDVTVYGRGQGSRSLSGSEGSQEGRGGFGWGKGSKGSGSNAVSWKKDVGKSTSSDQVLRQGEAEDVPTVQPCPDRIDMEITNTVVGGDREVKDQGNQKVGTEEELGTILARGDDLSADGAAAANLKMPEVRGRRGVQEGRMGVAGSLACVAGDVTKWSKDVVGELEGRIKAVRSKLDKCMKSPVSEAKVREEADLRIALAQLKEKKYINMKQRAHTWWLRGWQQEHQIPAISSTGKEKSKQTKGDMERRWLGGEGGTGPY